MEGSRYGALCGFVGSESTLVRIQADRGDLVSQKTLWVCEYDIRIYILYTMSQPITDLADGVIQLN